MASRLSKRQKRPMVISSDDEDSEALQQPSKTNGKSQELKSKSASERSDSNCAIHQIIRGKTRSTTLKSSLPLSTQTSRQPSPTHSPKKPVRKRTRSHNVGKTDSLYKFFSGASNTCSRHGSQCEADLTAEKIEEEDFIEDDSLDEEFGRLLASQLTTRSVLDRRKLNSAPSQTLAAPVQQQSSQCDSQKFIIQGKPLIREASEGPLDDDIDLRPWAERYGPITLEEVMVHKKKVADVRTWLEDCIQNRGHKVVLILKGPAGAGKTVTLSALAKDMDFDISEWKNPTDSSFASEGYVSMSAQFEEFLGRSGKYACLNLASHNSMESLVSSQREREKRKIILLEEFPNTFTSTFTALGSFRSSILNYLAANKSSAETLSSRTDMVPDNVTPLVMVITETVQSTASNDNLTAHRLLGPDILHHPSLSIIEFNPIAPTYLSKALDLVIQKEARQSGRRRIPGPSVLKMLSEVGDVRSAIASLEFLCLRGDNGDDWGGTVVSRNKKGANKPSVLTRMETESLEVLTQREASLGIFHSAAKVVYNKRDPISILVGGGITQPPDHLSQHARPDVPQISVDKLINETGTDPRTFIAALHENYVLSCEGATFTDSLNDCIDALSDSDRLCSDWVGRSGSTGLRGGMGRSNHQGAALDTLRQDEICFHLAVRGLLFALPSPVTRRAPPSSASIQGTKGARPDIYKMYYPASLRLSRRMEEVESLIDHWATRNRSAGLVPTTLVDRQHSEYPGSAAAAAAAPSGLVAAWNSKMSESTAESSSRTGGINAAKSELVLETLPYVAKIEKSKKSSPGLYRVVDYLEKVTQFHDARAPDDGDLFDTDFDSSFKSFPFRNWKKKRGEDDVHLALSTIGKLYLSDDDIED